MDEFRISCETCGHAFPKGACYECRRNPPEIDPNGKRNDMARFPIVQWDWWCSHYTQSIYALSAYRAELFERRKIRMLDTLDRTFEDNEFNKLRAIFALNGEESEQNEVCIRALLRCGWLEEQFNEEGVITWRITDAGLEALENDPWMNGSPEESP